MAVDDQVAGDAEHQRVGARAADQHAGQDLHLGELEHAAGHVDRRAGHRHDRREVRVELDLALGRSEHEPRAAAIEVEGRRETAVPKRGARLEERGALVDEALGVESVDDRVELRLEVGTRAERPEHAVVADVGDVGFARHVLERVLDDAPDLGVVRQHADRP